MRIWIDLANSPQVLFFRPIIRHLEERGHTIFITTRDFAQTVELADACQMRHTLIGKHGGKKWTRIIGVNLTRSLELVSWARKTGSIDLAVSHNSYSQACAASLLRIPFVTIMDYEHQPLNHLCFRLADRVIVPLPFPDRSLRRFGCLKKSIKYPGLKEQVYLADFQPRPDFLASHGIPVDRIVVTIRPPAPWTAYHRFENTVFDKLLHRLLGMDSTFIVFLPRIKSQADELRASGRANLVIADRALDGPNLLYHSDLVISGGGTMNREAAILGTPVYSVFQGEMAAVDQHLIQTGRMVMVNDDEDIGKIRVVKRSSRVGAVVDPGLVAVITDSILKEV